MLVDPYVHVEQFADIVAHTDVSRLLVGPHTDLPGLRLAARAVADDRRLEIRVSEVIHDRLFIPRSGAIRMLGASLNGVGKKHTILVSVDSPAADQIRSMYESVWNEAATLEGKVPEEE